MNSHTPYLDSSFRMEAGAPAGHQVIVVGELILLLQGPRLVRACLQQRHGAPVVVVLGLRAEGPGQAQEADYGGLGGGETSWALTCSTSFSSSFIFHGEEMGFCSTWSLPRRALWRIP